MIKDVKQRNELSLKLYLCLYEVIAYYMLLWHVVCCLIGLFFFTIKSSKRLFNCNGVEVFGCLVCFVCLQF